MGCEHKEGGGFYRPRQPRQMPFYQLVARSYPQFEAVYEERYQEGYGFWRPAIATAVEKFLESGDLQQGFARVRCPDCGHELFVALSCHGRCVSQLSSEAGLANGALGEPRSVRGGAAPRAES